MTPKMTPVIGYDDIDKWIEQYLQPHFPDKHISIIPSAWDATGESKFVTNFDMGDDLTITELCSKVVTEHSRGHYIHFYAYDVLCAAYTNGQLEEPYCILYYSW